MVSGGGNGDATVAGPLTQSLPYPFPYQVLLQTPDTPLLPTLLHYCCCYTAVTIVFSNAVLETFLREPRSPKNKCKKQPNPVTDARGRRYFWNVETDTVQWEIPVRAPLAGAPDNPSTDAG